MIPTDPIELQKKLHCSFYNIDELKPSPYLQEVVDEMRDLCSKYNFKCDPEQFVVCVCKCCPYQSKKSLMYNAALVVATWEADDILDNIHHVQKLCDNTMDSLISAFKTGKVEPYSAVADCFLDTLNNVKNQQLVRYFKNQYILYVETVRRHRKLYSTTIMEPEEYRKFRLIESGCDYTFSMAFLDNEEFPETFIMSNVGRKAWELAAENVSIINDLVSLKKDKKMGMVFNFVLSWMKGYNLTEDEAIDKLVLRAKHCYTELLEIKKNNCNETVTDTIEKLCIWVRGHVAWSISSQRYL